MQNIPIATQIVKALYRLSLSLCRVMALCCDQKLMVHIQLSLHLFHHFTKKATCVIRD
ncbi:Uncharacterised protein [Vibrio cholerae]|nr:Uncharacterised protein [Vibrio cholerae]